MKWLTLDKIKQQLRLDDAQATEEKKTLERFGASAENSILKLLRRSYTDLLDEYGEIPADVEEATLMLVDLSYKQRSPVDVMNTSVVGYTFDLKVKPYMRLATSEDTAEMTEVVKGDDTKIEFTADLPDGLKLSDVNFTGIIINADTAEEEESFTKEDCIMVGDGESYVVLVNTDEMGIGSLKLRLTVQIPDTDYQSGYRKAIIKINPHIRITG